MLELGDSFNQPLDLSHCKRLNKVSLGDQFDQPVSLPPYQISPQMIRAIDLSGRFNQPIPTLSYFTRLSYLVVGHDNNGPLYQKKCSMLENFDGKVMTAGQNFNQPLDISGLHQLKCLCLGNSFHQPLDLPDDIKSLVIGASYTHSLDLSHCDIGEIHVSRHYTGQLTLPTYRPTITIY